MIYISPFKKAEIEISCAKAAQFPESDRPEIVFLGRSNVGKSSLINKLLGRRSLARVSSVPGKTATANFYKADRIRIVDLPGYGYAKTSKTNLSSWKKLIMSYLEEERDLRLAVQLLDARHEPSKLDLEMIRYLIEGEFPFVIAFTKCDKLSQRQLAESMKKMEEIIPFFEDIISVCVSSEKGTGIEELAGYITEAMS